MTREGRGALIRGGACLIFWPNRWVLILFIYLFIYYFHNKDYTSITLYKDLARGPRERGRLFEEIGYTKKNTTVRETKCKTNLHSTVSYIGPKSASKSTVG